MITRDQWVRGTSVSGRVRSTLLTRLDTVIRSNPLDIPAIREALSAWIADGHEAWRTNQRNRTGVIQQLYNELGFGQRFGDFMHRLVTVTCNCRAGSRVLWVELKPGSDAQVWIDSGQCWVVDEDVANSTRFYSTVKALGNEVRNRTAPPDLVRVLSNRFPQRVSERTKLP